MGLVYADIEISNLKDELLSQDGHLKTSKIRRMTTRMMVDSGAIMMAINEDIQAQMGCPVTDRLKVQLADGTTLELDVVGPLRVRFGDRACTVDALVLPKSTEPLFGAIPMEYMDLIIDPAMQILGPHPSRPIRPVLSLK
jgi:clan AA aspartic protease